MLVQKEKMNLRLLSIPRSGRIAVRQFATDLLKLAGHGDTTWTYAYVSTLLAYSTQDALPIRLAKLGAL